MRLLDELNGIKQVDFRATIKRQKKIEKYKKQIIETLKSLRLKGVKEYRTILPCDIYEDLENYFKQEGIWILYLGSNDNKICRVLICPEVDLFK